MLKLNNNTVKKVKVVIGTFTNDCHRVNMNSQIAFDDTCTITCTVEHDFDIHYIEGTPEYICSYYTNCTVDAPTRQDGVTPDSVTFTYFTKDVFGTPTYTTITLTGRHTFTNIAKGSYESLNPAFVGAMEFGIIIDNRVVWDWKYWEHQAPYYETTTFDTTYYDCEYHNFSA